MIIGINARLILKHRMEGIARYAWETTKRMILAHPEDEFVLFFDREFDYNLIIADNVKGVVLSPQARHPILWKIWFDFRLTSALTKHKIDVLYSPDGFCSLRSEVPTLLASHDLTYKHYPKTMRPSHLEYYRKNVVKFHRKAKHIVCVSHFTKTDIIEHFGLDPQKLSVAYNAVNIPSYEVRDSEFSGPYFLYLGSIHPRKNIIRLLEAYELFRLRNKGLSPKFVFAGRKAFGNEELENAINAHPFRDDLFFMGMVHEDRKWNLMRHALAFVYVSLFEGFGIPVLEAMSQETPVICSDSGALLEVSGDAAIHADPHSHEQIALAMDKVVNDSTLRNELISKGKLRLNDFSWDDSADHIYSQLLAIKRK